MCINVYSIYISYPLFFKMFLNFNLNLRSLWRSIPNGYFSLTGFIRESSQQRTGKERAYSWWDLSVSDHFAGAAGTAAFWGSLERSFVRRTCEFQGFGLKFKIGLNNKAMCCHTCLTPLSSRSGTMVLLLNWNPWGPDSVFPPKSNSNLLQNTTFVYTVYSTHWNIFVSRICISHVWANPAEPGSGKLAEGYFLPIYKWKSECSSAPALAD